MTSPERDEQEEKPHRAPRGDRAGRDKDLAAKERGVKGAKTLPETDHGELVLRTSRGHAWLETASGEERHVLLPRWVQLVPGDVVDIDPQGRVNAMVPRRNVLLRQVALEQQALAANLDRIAVVVAPGALLREGFLNRALCVAAAAGIPPTVIFQKVDLDTDKAMRARADAYRPIAEVFLTSAKTGEGTNALGKALAGKATAFLGHSGVGKSSLVNAIFPGAKLSTSEVDAWGKGRHTTSLARAIRLGHALLVDLPGVRELGLPRFDDEVKQKVFPDLVVAEAACRDETPSCTHTDPERCLVLLAAAKGLVDAPRWDAYRAIVDSYESALQGGGR